MMQIELNILNLYNFRGENYSFLLRTIDENFKFFPEFIKIQKEYHLAQHEQFVCLFCLTFNVLVSNCCSRLS